MDLPTQDLDQVMEEADAIVTTELSRQQHMPMTVDPSELGLQNTDIPDADLLYPTNGLSLSPEVNFATASVHVSNGDTGSRPFDRAASTPFYEKPDLHNGVKEEKKPSVIVVRKPKFAALPYATSQTGLVYDVRMRFHVEPLATENDLHPEDPRRIWSIISALRDAGLVDDADSPGPSSEYYLGRISARYATQQEICAVHSQRHYNWVMDLANQDNEWLDRVGVTLDSVYLSRMTPVCAKLSAGGAIEACRAIMNKQVKNSIAVIRPPGHHAEHDHPAGFCFFNNVPIAARALQAEYGEACRKILIVDWDVHHGNGIQRAFYDDPNVLYISLHVHLGGRFYPSGDYGDHLHCGEGPGLGKNINIPWKTHNMGDGDYAYAFQQIVMPIAQEFDPDFVIVAAGFDAAEGDMLGRCHVSPGGYAQMTHSLMSLADGKICVCLEGGYNLRSIAVSALAVTKTLMGEAPERFLSTEPSAVGVDTVQMVLQQQRKFWPFLHPKDPSDRLPRLGAVRMHDIIRSYQAQELWEKYKLTPVFVARNNLSVSFENQVLATSNHLEARPLLLIFHDPPSAFGQPDPRTGNMELHNMWLTDVVKTYVEWAVEQDFAVMDINVPRFVTDASEENHEYSEGDRPDITFKETFQVAQYLWENYVEVSDCTHVFLMGVGAAYKSLVELMKTHERCTERITTVFSFISEQALYAVNSSTDDYLADWYFDHSLVFISPTHNYWEVKKRARKKFGEIVRSSKEDMQDMLQVHKAQITERMLRDSNGWQEIAAGNVPMDSEDELASMNGNAARDVVPGNPALASPMRFAQREPLSPGRR